MSRLECYSLLGLRPGATLQQIQRAYKRHALQHHPDRTHGDPDSVALFCRVTQAYTTLKGALSRHRRRARTIDNCPGCGRTAELFTGLAGSPRCAGCLLNSRRRLLPLPKIEVGRCVASFILQGLALYCVAGSVASGDWRLGAAGGLCVLAASGTLAYQVWAADVIHR